MTIKRDVEGTGGDPASIETKLTRGASAHCPRVVLDGPQARQAAEVLVGEEIVLASEAEPRVVNIANTFASSPADPCCGQTPASLFGVDEDDEKQQWNLAALVAAAQFGQEAEFLYQKPDSENAPGFRSVRVEDVQQTAGGDVLVVAFDLARQDYRCFRLDRIVSNVAVGGGIPRSG